MKIVDDFVRDNRRIQILSGGGIPARFPKSWGRVLGRSDMLVAIPDMHMYLYRSNLDNFKYGASALLDFIGHLRQVRAALRSVGRKLRVVQMGDMYELCFPTSCSSRRVTNVEIERSHPIYSAIVDGLRHLHTDFIYGNHDFELREHEGCRESLRDGLVHLEHGFAADCWYHFSNPAQPLWSPMMSVFRTVRGMEAAVANLRRTWMRLPAERHVAVGVSSGEREVTDYPTESSYLRRYLKHHVDRFFRERRHAGAPRVCVVAHSHHPYFDPEFAGGRAFYIDAGAWTDGRSDFAVITNAEAAICRYRRHAAMETEPVYRTAI